MTLEILKRSFPDMFFTRYLREVNVEEFINICEGCMSVLHYSLMFTKFSRYASFFVSNTSDEMSHFLMGVSVDLVEEFHSAMLNNNMKMFRLIDYSQQLEESRVRKKNRESKRAKSYEFFSSKGKLEIKDKARFKKRFSNKDPYKFPKARDYMVSNLKS